DFKRHISRCNNCQTLLMEFEGTYKILLKDKVPEPDEFFWENFNKKLFTKIDLNEPAKRIITFPFKKVFAFAASIIVVVLTGYYLRSFMKVDIKSKHVSKDIVVSKQVDSSKESKEQQKNLNNAYTDKNENESILIDTYLISADKNEETNFEETFDELSNFTHLRDISIIEDDNEYVTDELTTGLLRAYNIDLSEASSYTGNEISTFLDPEALVDDLYDDYLNLSDEERQFFEEKLDKVKS
ncbi:hypothetical protein KKB18_11770, partial [bacterium]|nr:hypothetical protein [bacterium]